MKASSKNKASDEVARSLIGVLAIVFVLLGTVCILIGAMISGHPTTQTVLINVGCGSLTSGVLSFVLDRYTRQINWIANDEAWSEHLADFKEMLAGDGGPVSLLKTETSRQARDMRVTLTEAMRCIYSDRIQREVFASGLIGAYPMWSGRYPRDFIASQSTLRLMLKDGCTFFKERRQELLERFKNPDLETKILLLHPDSHFMEAIAHMDDGKMNKPHLQVSDCKQAIKTLQKMRTDLLAEGIDIQNRVQVMGYVSVPTWSGAIGSSLGYAGFFFTRPYRGNLNFLVFKKAEDNGLETALYEAFDREFEELWRYAVSQGGVSLFEYPI